MKTYGETFLSISRSFLFCSSHNKICDWLQQIFIKFLSISIMNFFHYYKIYFIANVRCIMICIAQNCDEAKVSFAGSTSIVLHTHIRQNRTFLILGITIRNLISNCKRNTYGGKIILSIPSEMILRWIYGWSVNQFRFWIFIIINVALQIITTLQLNLYIFIFARAHAHQILPKLTILVKLFAFVHNVRDLEF